MRGGEAFLDPGHGAGSQVEDHSVLGHCVGGHRAGLRVFLESPRDHRVRRQQDVAPSLPGIAHDPARVRREIGFAERFTDRQPLRLEEGVRHPAAHDQGIGPLRQVGEKRELGRDLGTAHDGDDGPRGVAKGLAQGFQLGLHEAPGRARQARRHGGRRSVGAVCGREGVVDIEIGKGGESVGEARVVRLLALVEAQVLQEDDVAGRERLHGGGGLGADAGGGETDRAAAKRPGERRPERCQRHGGDCFAPRPAEMGHGDDPRAPVRQLRQGRRHPVDAGGVAQRPLAHRHVEVDAHEDALAGDLDIVERPERPRGRCRHRPPI